MAKMRFMAGGGQGDDVLGQVDSFIEGRPMVDSGSDSGGKGDSESPLQGVIWAARNAIFGKPKPIEAKAAGPAIPKEGTTTGPPPTETSTANLDGADKPKMGKNDGVLGLALKLLGGII